MTSVAKGVVLLDDEKAYLELLGPLLETGLECPVHSFDRPKAALAALNRLSVGVVVTDFNMPEMNGLEMIAQAQVAHPELRFIIITGHGLHFSDEDAHLYPGVKAVLHKPFGWRKLADAICQHWPDEEVPHLRR